MALNYTTSPNGFFIQLGLIAKHYFAQRGDAIDLSADGEAILDSFQAMDAGDPDLMTEGFATQVANWQAEHVSRRSSLRALALTRLQDRVTILDEIGATSLDINEILRKLIAAMIADSETVDRSTVTIGAVSAAAGNEGNGTVLTTKVLDAVTSPGSGAAGTYAASRHYKGVDSELAVPSESMRLTCTADSFADGLSEGAETFNWEGRIADNQHGYRDEGSGVIGTIAPIHSTGTNILQNGDFEDFTANVPNNWTIFAGTAGTHIVEETSAADVYHGDNCLRFDGDGAQATIEIRQAISAADVVGGKRYCVACRLKGSATIAAGAVTIQFEGTGYAAGGSEKISIAAGAIPTSFALQHFFVNMPDTIPSDFRLVIRWSGTPTAAKKLWIDDIALGPVSYGGGIGIVIVRGSDAFTRDDQFSFDVSNDDAGAFQKFFRQNFGVQLPSAGGGAETVDDALTT